MSRLDDIQKEIDARMAAIQGRIFGSSPAPAPAPTPTPAPKFAPDFAERGGTVQPALTAADLEAVSKKTLQVVGFAPGAQVSNLPPNFPAALRDLMLLVAEVAKRQSMPIGAAVVAFRKDGKTVGRQQLPYQPTQVFQSGIPSASSASDADIARKVAQSAAYYVKRIGTDRFDTIGTLWAFVDAVCDLDAGELRVAYACNAFSTPLRRGGRQALLCFSPQVTDLPVVCHEMTHSVSHDLVGWGAYYVSETGAINESCSDIFGKFAEFAWKGRDPSDPKRWRISTFRDMAHPSQMKDRSWKAADYYLEPPDAGNPKSGWIAARKPGPENDNGGVHTNSGVLARLCFLLCEGETFMRKDGRRFDVPAIGFDRTEALLARAFFGGYLTERPSVYDAYHAIVRASKDLDFTADEAKALAAACEAVNIIPPAGGSSGLGGSEMICENRSLRGFGGDVASALASAYARELGLDAPGSGYVCDDCGTSEGARGVERSLKYRQTFEDLPVFGASAVARVDGDATVTFLNSGFSRRLGSVRAAGPVDAESATDVAQEESGGLETLSCEKIVFDPALFGFDGEPTVAWRVVSGLGENAVSHRIIDSTTGEVLFEAPLQIE